MLSPNQDVPAYRVSATARELERIRAKRRLLETVAKGATTSAQTVVTEAQQQSPSVPKLEVDPANRNAKIKANARKLLDHLQAADTSLADSAHNLKLMFAKQALRALAERQAAVAAEAQQRKLDKLREQLTEEHRRQQQQQHAIQTQLHVQQQTLPQTQLPPRTPIAKSPVHAHGPDAARQHSPTRLEHRRSPSSRHQSRSRRDRRGRSPSRRSPSPPPQQQRQQRTVDEFDSISGYSCESDVQQSDAAHVRDTRRSSSPSRDRPMYVSRLNAGYQREPRLAGPTEAGVWGAVSAQALSALLAGLQSHGVNLTSGPPPLPPAAAGTQNNQSGRSGEGAKGAAGAPTRSGSGVGTGSLSKGGEGGAEEHQYVLLPDGTVGLVHTIVKPAVLQPRLTAAGTIPPPAPHAVPLVLLQPSSPGAVGNVTPAPSAPPATIAPWPTLPHTGMSYPYGTMTAPVGPTPAPFYPSPLLGIYGAQAQYPYLHAMYGLQGSIPPASYSFQSPASTAAGAPPQYISPYLGPDGGYYRHPQYQQQQQQQQQQLANQGAPTAMPAAVGTAAHIDDSQAHPYVHYHSNSPRMVQGRGGPGQLSAAPQPQLGRDADNNVRHSISSLSSDPYGNLAGSVIIGTEDGAVGGGGAITGGNQLGGGGGGGYLRGLPQASSPPAAMAPGPPNPPPSSSGAPSFGTTETSPGNGPGGSGVYSGSRYHHRRSHSGAESLRSLPSNSGGSTRGGPGSLSMSHHYEPTLASPSLRGSQDLDSPASFRDMPRLTSGSINLSPMRGSGTGTGGGSIDSGPHFGGGAGDGVGASRRRPSPLFVSSVAAPRSPDPSMSPVVPSGSSESSSGGSVVLRVTAAGSVPAQVPQGGSGFSGSGEPSGLGSAAGTGGGEEPSLLLRTLDLGSASMQRSKMSDDQAETPTSRKPSLTSPWSSSEVAISPSGGGNLGGSTPSGIGGSGGASAGTFPSTHDLFSDVVSRPPLYGTSLPYGTAGLYDRYTVGGFYGATGSLYGPSPLYGAPPTGGGSFGGFDVVGVNGSLLDRVASGGSGGAPTGGAAPRSPSSDSLRSNGIGVKGYTGTASPGATQGGPTGLSTATSDLTGTSTALALTAAILEGSHASAAANAIIAGSTVGLSAASVYGLSQLGLSHLHPIAAAVSPTQPAAGAAAAALGPGSAPAPAAGSLGRSPSMNRRAQDSESSGGIGSGAASSIVPGHQSMPAGSPTNGSALTQLSHGSNLESMFSPRSRSRVQLMGNDDLTDAFSPRSPNIFGSNGRPTPQNGQQPQPQVQLGATGSMRLTAATLNAQQQQLQQQQMLLQGPFLSQQHSHARLDSNRYPASGASGGSGSAATLPTGATDIGGLQPTVPTLHLPPRASSRMLGSAVGVAAAATATVPLPPTASGASAPSSETASPTRTENQGISDLRDIDAEQSLSARSGRSALSEGPAAALSTSSMERVSGVPVVENQYLADSGPDAASYAGLLGAQSYNIAANIGGGGGGGFFSGAYSSTGFVASGAPMSTSHLPPQPLPPLLEILSNSHFAAAASPSGSAGLFPLGFGGGNTPLERSTDSFVRMGSMPISGAASPMATANPIELLGSPTKQPTGQVTTLGTRGSSGGTSSAGGGGSTGGGTSSRGVVSATISAALPQLPPSTAPASVIPQQVAAATPSNNPQPQAVPAGISAVMGTQQQLSGTSFRMSNTVVKGGGLQAMAPGGYVTNAHSNPAAAGPASAAPAPAVSAEVGTMAWTSSGHSMALAASPQTAAGPSTKVLSPSDSRNARAPAATLSTTLPPSLAQRAVSKTSASTSGLRTSATAIVNRVLAGRGEFDSDDNDEEEESSGFAGGGDDGSFSVSLRGGPGSSLQRGGSIGTSAGMATAKRAGGAVISPGRGVLTGASTVDDDEFNF